MKYTTCDDCGYMFRCMRCINADEDAVAAPVDPQLARIAELEAALAQSEREKLEHARVCYADLDRVKAALAAEKERRRKADERNVQILMLAENWPLRDVVAKLAGAARHLLKDHDCDAHGWEEIGTACESAERWVRDLDAPTEGT